MTGDGVHDVPALQAADIGIAMGERGMPSAREVAAIVLLDDNFRSIVRSIAEGGQLFHNLRLAFAHLLMIHIPFVLSAALIPLMNNPLRPYRLAEIDHPPNNNARVLESGRLTLAEECLADSRNTLIGILATWRPVAL